MPATLRALTPGIIPLVATLLMVLPATRATAAEGAVKGRATARNVIVNYTGVSEAHARAIAETLSAAREAYGRECSWGNKAPVLMASIPWLSQGGSTARSMLTRESFARVI